MKYTNTSGRSVVVNLDEDGDLCVTASEPNGCIVITYVHAGDLPEFARRMIELLAPHALPQPTGTFED